MTDRIEITPLGGDTYAVTVQAVGTTTQHRVRVPAALVSDLGLGPDEDERLVRSSFEFLLEREPATSILSSFDLDLIGRYFPEFMATMRARVRPGD